MSIKVIIKSNQFLYKMYVNKLILIIHMIAIINFRYKFVNLFCNDLWIKYYFGFFQL